MISTTVFSDHESDDDSVKGEPESGEDSDQEVKPENDEDIEQSDEDQEIPSNHDDDENRHDDDEEDEDENQHAVTRRSPRIRENSVLREKQSTNSRTESKKVDSKRKNNRYRQFKYLIIR